MFIIDAHLDLSMNAMEWNRDLRIPIADMREREFGITDKPDRAKGTVTFPEMRKGNIGLCVATQIARYVDQNSDLPGWHSQEQAWAQTQGQLAWYRAMEKAGELTNIYDLKSLLSHLEMWKGDGSKEHKSIGYILSLEGADSIISMEYLEEAHSNGLRALGPAHYGPGVYAFGTDSTGGIGKKGKELLSKMEDLNIILDATHLCDESFWEALDHFNGPVWASHNNCRTIVPHNRQFNAEQIKALIQRGAVIGAAFDAWMIIPDWVRAKSTPENTGLKIEHVIDHMDHICQLAGNANHVGIGTDLDGAFGKEQCPKDIDTIADLQKIPEILSKRGYTSADIEKIMNRNWITFLKNTWRN